ncbi:MAG: DsbA family protein [Gemmatimonadales bacterium]
MCLAATQSDLAGLQHQLAVGRVEGRSYPLARHLLIGALAVGLLASGFALARLVDRELDPRSPETGNSGVQKEIRQWDRYNSRGHRIGSSAPRLVLLEFGDFECPACAVFQREVVQPLLRDYPGEVALVYRHWPLPYHRYAYTLAVASECAELAGAFGGFHQAVFDRQDSIGVLSLADWAQRSGITTVRSFLECAAGGSQNNRVEADIEAVRELGGVATPTVFINGRYIPNATESASTIQYVSELLR